MFTMLHGGVHQLDSIKVTCVDVKLYIIAVCGPPLVNFICTISPGWAYSINPDRPSTN